MSTPTPPTVSTSGTATASGSTSPVFTIFIEIIGVIVLTIVAGIGARTGKIVALFMAGLLVLWAVTHASVLARIMPGQNVSVQG